MTAPTQANATGQAPSAGTILCVDDEPHILSSLRRLLRPYRYTLITAQSAREGLELLKQQPVDVVVSDMRMPEMDGAAFLSEVAAQHPDTVRVLLTGYADTQSAVSAINEGRIFRYLQKPWDDHDICLVVKQAMEHRNLMRERQELLQLTQQQNLELKQLNDALETKVEARTLEIKQTADMLEEAYDELKHGYTAAIEVFASLIERRNSKRGDINRWIAETAAQLAVKMGMSAQETEHVYYAGLLRELGKLCLPDAITEKPYTALSAEERALYQQHPLTAEAALTALAPLSQTATIIRSHRERIDGKGYPEGLSGEAIPLGARILRVVADYQKLQHGALIKETLSAAQACEFLNDNTGERYDRAVVDQLLALLEQSGFDEQAREIELSSKQLAEGMVLARDLLNQNGLLILARGFRINESIIARLRKLEFDMGKALVFHVRENPATHERCA